MKKGVRTVPLTKIINCRNCGKEIEVPWESKKYLCEDCKQKSFKSHFKKVKEQKILCRNPECSNVVKTVIKKGSKSKDVVRGGVLCEYCKNHPKMKEREVRCSSCGKLITTETLKDTYQLKEVIYKGLCTGCVEQKKIKSIKKLKIKEILIIR